jgi:hypothetical protein
VPYEYRLFGQSIALLFGPTLNGNGSVWIKNSKLPAAENHSRGASLKNQGANSARLFSLVVATLLLTAVLPPAARTSPHPAPQPPAQNKIYGPLTFVFGTICKGDEGEYLLRDASGTGLFWLDNQQAVAKFLGKSVSITGILDGPNNLIRILSIHSAN